MKKNLIAFLFGESQVDEEIAGLVESIADMDAGGDDALKVEKQPLSKALSSLGIEAKGLENDPRGLSLVLGSAEDYRAAHAILNEPDSMHKLAHLGWVASPQGDVAMANEPGEFRIRFLEIDEVEPADDKASYAASDKARLNKVKDIIKKGREFATTAPDFDDENNPVDHSAPKKGSRNKGVGDAKDGSDPKGTPKGSEGSPSAGKSGSAPGKGDLTQPEEGQSPKAVREARGGKGICRYCGSHSHTSANCPTGSAGRKSVKEAGFMSQGGGTGTYHSGHGAPVRMSSANVDLSPVAPQMRSGHTDDEIAGNAEYLRQNGILHAQGCECEDCKADPIGISQAASRQGRGGLPFDVAAGQHHRIGEAGHKAGCGCGFCKNKGNIATLKGGKGKKKPEGGLDGEETDESLTESGKCDQCGMTYADSCGEHFCRGCGRPTPEHTHEDEVEESAESIVNSMLEGNPGTPPPVTGKGKDRKFRPAKGMVQAAPENSVVAKQTKPNRSA